MYVLYIGIERDVHLQLLDRQSMFFHFVLVLDDDSVLSGYAVSDRRVASGL